MIFFCALVDVDGVAHRLEGVERNTDRERKLQQLNRCAEKTVYRCKDKIGVFEKTEQSEIDRHRHNERDFGLFRPVMLFGGAAAAVVEDGRKNHQSHVYRLSPRIKQQAEHKQHKIFPLMRREIVDNQHRREIAQQKGQT